MVLVAVLQVLLLLAQLFGLRADLLDLVVEVLDGLLELLNVVCLVFILLHHLFQIKLRLVQVGWLRHKAGQLLWTAGLSHDLLDLVSQSLVYLPQLLHFLMELLILQYDVRNFPILRDLIDLFQLISDLSVVLSGFSQNTFVH